MADTPESETGVQTLSDTAQHLVAKVEAAAERSRQRQQRSGRPASQRSGGEQWRVDRALRIYGVPPLYRAATWERLESPVVKHWCETLLARVPDRSGERSPRWDMLGHGLLIVGPVGTGKSSAAGVVCRKAAERGLRFRWSYVPDLVDRLSQSARDREHEIRLQAAVDVLVWDDLGVRALADWEIGFLDQIVEARYRSRRPMVVTTNLPVHELRQDVRMARLLDRWRERTASQGAVLGGESRRRDG